MSTVLDTVLARPRVDLVGSPTPIEHLHRLSQKLGIEIFIKRDDLIGLGMGGNKIRQLEFYFGAAREQSADTVLITGAVQSNYVRATAAAAARLGMETVIQLEERVAGMGPTYHTSGNRLLDDLLGARVILYPDGEDEAGADLALHAEADRLRKAGRRPYVIPLGLDNPPLGALGYILAAREIAGQDTNFDHVVVASGSGLTHTGLLAGLRAEGVEVPVHGACVRRAASMQRERIRTVADRLADLLACGQMISDADILTWDTALQPGYGRIGAPAREAIALMAEMAGLFVDPVYTAKSFAVLVDLVRSGRIGAGARVLFIHTGGTPAIFAYEPELRR